MNKSILIIDDDKELADITSDMLKSYGYQVTIAHDGDEAYSLLGSSKFNLILLDINLPRETGFEICRVLRKVSTVPIIFASARTSENDRITGFDLGGDDYLPKPYSLKELLSRNHTSIHTDPTMIKSILKGRAPRYDNEIVVTEIVAKDLGVRMGDTVIISNEKLEKEYIICGYFQCTSDLGRTIAMSSEGAKRIIPDYNMTYVDYILSDSSKSAEVVDIIKDKYRNRIDTKDMNTQSDFDDTIINSMSVLNIVIYTISILFAFVVIVTVCGKVFLKERTDYGIYKALGFSSGTLRLQFALRFAIVAFIGSLLGVIMNLCLNNAMMNSLLSNIGISNFPTAYTLSSIIFPVSVLTLCFFVFAYFVSGRIKRVDTRSLISDN